MKVAALIITLQLVAWFIAWRIIQWHGASEPDEVLKDAAFCFFFWWLITPICGYFILNEWIADRVRKRRARIGNHGTATLRSGQDNGLYG